MSADPRTAELAAEYLLWFIPAMALQFTMVAMGSSLRAIGNFKTGMLVGTASVIANMILAPFLIFGWGIGRPLGVAGAAIASLVSVVLALVWLLIYFLKRGRYLRFDLSAWRPRVEAWKKMLAIGLPTGYEFGITTVYLALVYAIARPFGAAPLVSIFTNDPAVITVGTAYLRIVAFSYVGSGLVFVISSMFQAMGNTVPSMVTSTLRIALFAIPALILVRQPGFHLTWLWYLSLASVYLQLFVAFALLRREFRRRLHWDPATA